MLKFMNKYLSVSNLVCYLVYTILYSFNRIVKAIEQIVNDIKTHMYFQLFDF